MTYLPVRNPLRCSLLIDIQLVNNLALLKVRTMKLTYRISTIFFLVLIFLTAITDICRMDFVVRQVTHLGYPGYLPIMIGSGKLLGIFLLSLPKYSRWKEWAYAGFTVLFVSAAVSHSIVGDPIGNIAGPLLAEAILLTSYFSREATTTRH